MISNAGLRKKILDEKSLADRLINISLIKFKKNLKKSPFLEKSDFSNIEIVIKTAVENAKNIKDKTKIIVNEGYGTISKNYGIGNSAGSYLDYGKLFSYLGRFKSKSPYQSISNEASASWEFMAGNDDGFYLLDKETMEQGARHVKYFIPKSAGISPVSLVPIGGLSSQDWEQFKWLMMLNPVMYIFKTSIA